MWFTVSGGLVPLSQSPDKAPDSQLLEILSTGEALELCEKLPGTPGPEAGTGRDCRILPGGSDA